MDSTTVGLMSDTHGVWDEAVTVQFRGVAAIVHAGDIGPGAAAIIQHLAALAEVTAVRGNVDERDAEGSAFPAHALLELAGWRILVSHIVGLPPKVAPDAVGLIQELSPDIVVCGHSHVFGVGEAGGVLYVNPGSAGPARFRLGRSVALLELPPKESGRRPAVRKIELAVKAPPRLTSAAGKKRRRGKG